MRARGVVVGVERVREAAKGDTLHLALVASDAAAHSQDKVRPLLAARGVFVIDAPSGEELGRAVGRDMTAAVGVTDVHLARGIQLALGVASGDAHRAPHGAGGGGGPTAGPRGRGRTRRMD